jgi:hypothetical protein
MCIPLLRLRGAAAGQTRRVPRCQALVLCDARVAGTKLQRPGVNEFAAESPVTHVHDCTACNAKADVVATSSANQIASILQCQQLRQGCSISPKALLEVEFLGFIAAATLLRLRAADSNGTTKTSS